MNCRNQHPSGLRLIAVAGGIGSGKSVVSRILRICGYEVYDCDSRARKLMENSEDIARGIASDICPEAVLFHSSGLSIDRKILAEAVFSDSQKLSRLNELVHKAVKDDIMLWAGELALRGATAAFVETAILYASGLDKMVDEVWHVDAPEQVRISRAVARDSASAEHIRSRIQAQMATESTHRHPSVSIIYNDGIRPILPQIESLLATL